MNNLTILFFGFFSVTSFCNGVCIEREKQALLELKQGLVDPADILASWVANNGDCCGWKGVVCHNLTGHVLQLHLSAPTDYLDIYDSDDDFREDYATSQLSGKISHSLLHLKHLNYLNLSRNDFRGIQIPKFFGSLRSLRCLDLSRAGFAGKVPQYLRNLSNLQYLNLHGPIPCGFQNLTLLKHLDLSSNHFNSTIPDWLYNFSPLEFLNLMDNNLQGQISNAIGEMSSAIHLDLSGNNNLEGKIPSFFPTVDLNSNNVTGPLPPVSSNLYFLDLSNNGLSGSINHFLCHEMNATMAMQILNLGNNSLSGELPDCWTKWSSVNIIILSKNRFSGEIPSSIGTLRDLNSLHLQNNNLSEEIPSSLRNCIELQVLDLSENELDRNIPPWIGINLTKLIILSLRSNKFWGHVGAMA
ncbi:hypothetical protein SLEP1_g44389 [Rubroshorea leprosula]|uniref:Leucine-rich repeat-containing N-terminal plant-type domain-containing protein n=1 Tax=Rubroshorea leprosula TaxID=152421 RepID=A0AAV5LGN1_9ROSI|nr:hypothetical protein SLEP1_g44389 [Rubroshorea leprosula]